MMKKAQTSLEAFSEFAAHPEVDIAMDAAIQKYSLQAFEDKVREPNDVELDGATVYLILSCAETSIVRKPRSSKQGRNASFFWRSSS